MDTPFTPDETLAYLRQHAGESAILAVHSEGPQVSWEIDIPAVPEICRLLKNTPGLWYDMLACISATDNRDDRGFGVVVHLTSLVYEQQCVLKYYRPEASLPEDPQNRKGLPEFPSLSEIWPAAIWHEREAYDLMGIWFTGHPDLRRILLPEDWQGYPLRKDYKPAETYHDIKIEY